jgi:putative methyltransferase (TIGR04325 family)
MMQAPPHIHELSQLSGTASNSNPGLRRMIAQLRQGTRAGALPFKALIGRMRYLDPRYKRFQGLYESYDQAFAVASRKGLAGYDHDEVAPVSFEAMCRVESWDYPVMFWLRDILAGGGNVLDAGGHMGTKYRAFAPYLNFNEAVTWTVYDLLAIVRAGHAKAMADGLVGLSFVTRIADAPAPKVFLASGLLQYLERPLDDLLGEIKSPPEWLLFNKVAFHGSGPAVTLERIGNALVPYQMRERTSFVDGVERLGYRLTDSWRIAELSHTISTHPEIGPSESAGFLFRRL